ncbi:tRNA (adenosine(37)-N6)-threonylcarbamoyltransferase complex dimerization subunit type 1 TsaB [Nitrospira sp.]|nr:tRNA (adenosine(37)-N6)-threonylcarbamoyltransferase complex dimerization subunit type 1 TsaB [Nitrospira sp.]
MDVKVLAIETATSRQSVAIVEESRVLASAAHDEPGSHTRWLIPTIDRLLETARCTLAELHGFVVSAGPGSFTGLRVGISTALGLRAVTGRPIILVGTLEAMAWGARGLAGPLCPILPCRKGEVFWAQYEWAVDGQIKTLVEPHVGPPEAIKRMVATPTWVLGDGWKLLQEAMAPMLTDRARRWREVPVGLRHPSATHVAMAGFERLRRGDVAGHVVIPNYVQRAEAELQRGQVEGKAAKILRGAGKAPRRASRR